MSIINSLSSPYYQLSNLLGGGTQLPKSAASPSLADALLQGGSDSSSDNNSDAFMLDLSPQAQAYLSGMGQSSIGGSGSFLLSADQRKQIGDILAKYKDAPYTQATFNQIQQDMDAIGLSPEILGMMDQAHSFDPALVLIDALNGGSGSNLPFKQDNTQAKSDAYMQQIIKQWQSISTTYQA